MDSEEDGRLAPIRSFALTGFRLDPEGWRAFVGQEENTVTLESFCSSHDHGQLFLHRGPGSGLRAGLSFPEGVQTKVLWLSKTVRDPLTKDNARARVRMQELRGGDALGCLVSLTQEVSVPLLSDRGGGAPGVSESALRILERQRNAAQVMKAQVEGHTFLPQPDALRPHGNGYRDDGHDKQEPLGEGGRHDDGLQGELVDVKLLHACEGTVVEWAELVSEFLQQDWSKPVLEGLRPLPSEAVFFWRSRLQNLLFLQNQLTGARAQQVAAIIQAGESIYWATLRDIYRDVQEGLEEAQDVVQHLTPLQQQLQQLEELEFRQLRDHMTPVMEQVRLLWTRSRFYCKPCRVVVLLQEFCNLLIHQSRKFLRGQEVIRSLASDPGPVLNDVRLVIRTLKTLKEAYAQTSSLLDTQNQNQVPGAGVCVGSSRTGLIWF
ncbi:dynein axonemal heavy chain 17-like [Menidia menidia]